MILLCYDIIENTEMTSCFFVSDLHGQVTRYQKFFEAIAEESPAVVLLGGDLLPHAWSRLSARESPHADFIADFLVPAFTELRESMAAAFPKVALILGNDDPRVEEPAILRAQASNLWHYLHNHKMSLGTFSIYGYACVPPTPFQLKDWERYDVSRHTDPGCVSPEEGRRSLPASSHDVKFGTIEKDLAALTGNASLEQAIFLFHAPPYRTNLDRAALDGKMVEHVPLDVHVGSIAVKRLIEARQPLLTLHGHIHESARLTGNWRERIGRTWAFSAAHDGPELALVRFDLESPATATRELI